MAILQTRISPQRRIAFITAGIIILLIVFNVVRVIWICLAGVVLILAVTDYGRRCPLLLSLHYLYARIQKKSQET